MRTCSSCSHPDVVRIDEALRAGRETQDAIARRFNVTPQALSRHRARHLRRRPSSSTAARLGPTGARPGPAPEPQPEPLDLLSREDFVQVICFATGRNRGGNTPVDPELPSACFDDTVAAGRYEDLTRRPGIVFDEWIVGQEEARNRA